MAKHFTIKRPIRLTVIVILVSTVISIVFSMLSLYLERTVAAQDYIGVGYGRPGMVMMAVMIVSNDLSATGRYLAEIGVVVLVVQLVRQAISR